MRCDLHQTACVQHGDNVRDNLQLSARDLVPLLQRCDELLAYSFARHGFHVVEGLKADGVIIEFAVAAQESLDRGADTFLLVFSGLGSGEGFEEFIAIVQSGVRSVGGFGFSG